MGNIRDVSCQRTRCYSELMYKEILSKVLKLTPAERIELVHDIWDSIRPEDYPPPSEATVKEIERRVALYEANPERGIPWETAKEQLEDELLSIESRRKAAKSAKDAG